MEGMKQMTAELNKTNSDDILPEILSKIEQSTK